MATVIDRYSRRMVGWVISNRMIATRVCDGRQMALWRRHSPEDVIVHSDRGNP
ncbi:MAG: DDE-type integrase/transposase/recombinase [Porticoccaceae bacterium]